MKKEMKTENGKKKRMQTAAFVLASGLLITGAVSTLHVTMTRAQQKEIAMEVEETQAEYRKDMDDTVLETEVQEDKKDGPEIFEWQGHKVIFSKTVELEKGDMPVEDAVAYACEHVEKITGDSMKGKSIAVTLQLDEDFCGIESTPGVQGVYSADEIETMGRGYCMWIGGRGEKGSSALILMDAVTREITQFTYYHAGVATEEYGKPSKAEYSKIVKDFVENTLQLGKVEKVYGMDTDGHVGVGEGIHDFRDVVNLNCVLEDGSIIEVRVDQADKTICCYLLNLSMEDEVEEIGR